LYHKAFFQATLYSEANQVTRKMSETQVQKKKRKKQQFQALQQAQEEIAIQNATGVAQALEELEAQGIRLDIQVCPKCKSPKVRRAKSTGGDMWGHLGMVQPSYECPDCGWQERVVLKATNKPSSVRDVELTREAMDVEDNESE
jgi:transposase-like protein